MAIPDYQTLMLPVLKILQDNQEHFLGDVIEQICSEFKLTEQERQEVLPSGQQPIIDNRVGWARTYLLKAGLLEYTRRGYTKITQKGLEVLNKKPSRIDIKFLEQFPEFIEFRNTKKESSGEKSKSVAEIKVENITPDELMDNGFNSIQASLGQELLSRIRMNPPAFFEKLVVKLLESMGYGRGKVTGRSGDDGIDGYIYQDKLGLDKILFQAKRFGEDTPVPALMVRDFFGALDINGANKGVFITTSKLPRNAESGRSSKSIIFIDGQKLVELMIEYNVGVQTTKTYEIKKVDTDFFDE